MLKKQSIYQSLRNIDLLDPKTTRRPACPNTYTPLLLMMLAACGGGGGGLGGPRVKISDDGTTFSKVWENTTLVESTSHETNYEAVEQFLETFRREVESVAGKSPGKAKLNDFYLAPDGKSVTFKMGFVNPKLSLLSFNLKIELVGDDAEFFRMVRLDGLGSKIEFITAPNYERPSDKDADNTYRFKLKNTITFDKIGEPEINYTRYFVSVADATGKNDPGEETNILRAISVPENTAFKTTHDEIANNLFTLNRLNNLHNVFFKNSESSEDGSSATVKMHDKKTGHISEVTIKITGPDAAHIQILGGNKLYFRTVPDYEKPADSNGDNIYEFSLVYTGLKAPETTHFRITITDVDEPILSQGRSNQSMEAFYPGAEYNMPETDDSPPPADIL